MKVTKAKLKQFIKEEIKAHKETIKISDSELERMVATWNTSIGTDGNPTWKKRHNIRSAHVVSDQAAGKWRWVVFEFTKAGDEEDVAQGVTASFRDAILRASKQLKDMR